MKQIVVSLSKIIMQGRRSENRVGYKQYVDLVEMEKWMKQDQWQLTSETLSTRMQPNLAEHNANVLYN